MLAGILLLLLAGCVAKPPTVSQSGLPTAPSFFACTPSDGAGDGSNAPVVEIDPGADADEIILKMGQGYPQHLDAVAGSADRIFANAAYAWRLASPAPVLTDIDSFQTYRCVPR